MLSTVRQMQVDVGDCNDNTCPSPPSPPLPSTVRQMQVDVRDCNDMCHYAQHCKADAGGCKGL